MLNIYNPMALSLEQKLVYVSFLCYLAKADANVAVKEESFIKAIIARFQISPLMLKQLKLPASVKDFPAVLAPIKDQEVAIDLLHCLWFATLLDDEIAQQEIETVREIAKILNINDETLLMLNNFVSDEISFLQQAEEVLKTNLLAL